MHAMPATRLARWLVVTAGATAVVTLALLDAVPAAIAAEPSSTGPSFVATVDPPSTTSSTPPTTATTSAAAHATVPPPTMVAALPPDAAASPDAPGGLTSTSRLTVTPSTNLRYQEAVTLTGAGFPPLVEVTYAQCRADATEPADCGGGAGVSVTDASGGFVAPITVRRFLSTGDGEVDCATAAGACIVGAAVLDGYTDGTSAPLQFDPNAPIPPPPVLRAAPATDLGYRTTVHVTGDGFVPGDAVLLWLCVRGSSDLVGCGGIVGVGDADGRGSVQTDVHVTRVIRLPDGMVVDCARAPGCDLVARSLSESRLVGSVALQFDPDAPLPPPADVVVTPSTGLADRQAVAVSASGFEPHTAVLIAQCPASSGDVPAAPAFDRCGLVRFAGVDADGTARASMPVRRVLGAPGSAGVDCAVQVGTCVVVVSAYDGVFPYGAAPLAFDPDAPPVPPPTISAHPTTDLVDGAVVTVTGSGFTPHAQVALVQCRDQQGQDDSGQGCALQDGLQYAWADGAGNVAATYTVRRFITTPRFGTVDCATDVDGCILGWGALADLANDRGSIRLSFATGGPPGPGPGDATGPGGAVGPGTPLAFTGSSATPLALAGGALAALGLGLIVATRTSGRYPLGDRRRHRAARCAHQSSSR